MKPCLPDELVVDGTRLSELHDKITVADLTVPEGVTILTELDHPIASVVETKAMMAEEAVEAEEGEEAAEGEEGTEAESGKTVEGEAVSESSEEKPEKQTKKN